MIGRWLATLSGLAARRRIENEIREELTDHVERQIELHRARGLGAEEARRLALRELGGLTHTIETTREVRMTWLDSLWRDARYAARVLRRTPRFTATALTLLVLAIGSTTAIYSIAYSVLLRPLPFPDADRLVFLGGREGAGMIWPNYEEWRRRATSFDGGVAGSLADARGYTPGGVTPRVESPNVTPHFFPGLGVAASPG